MSKVNLYILKRACSDLQNLKLYERQYKAALVKRACYLIKSAEDDKKEEEELSELGLLDELSHYDHMGAAQQKRIRDSLDYSGVYSSNPILKFLTGFTKFDKRHEQNMVGYLTSEKLFPPNAAGLNDMDKYLLQYGYDKPEDRQRIIRDALANRARANKAIEASEKRRKGFAARGAQGDYDQAVALLNSANANAVPDEKGKKKHYRIVADDEDSGTPRYPWGNGFYSPSSRAPNYVTDNLAFYHPELLEAAYRAGNTVNNYYYINGKPIASALGNPTPGLDDIVGKNPDGTLILPPPPSDDDKPATASLPDKPKKSTTLDDVWKNEGFKHYDGSDMSPEEIAEASSESIRPWVDGSMSMLGFSDDTIKNVHDKVRPIKNWWGRFAHANSPWLNGAIDIMTDPDDAARFTVTEH